MDISIKDRIAIQELVCLYAIYCDTHQFDKLADLFTDDCVYDETCTGIDLVTDKTGLRSLFDYFSEQLGPVMHTCSNHVISDYTGTSARGICYVQAEGMRSEAGDNAPIRVLGYYDDAYAKLGSHWYFKERRLKPLVPGPGFPTTASISYDTGPRRFATRPQA